MRLKNKQKAVTQTARKQRDLSVSQKLVLKRCDGLKFKL